MSAPTRPPARGGGRPQLDPNDCPRCGGDGDIALPAGGRCTCPVCRGSGLSGPGEAELRRSTR